MFGSPETTTGGRALKFYSSIRIDIRRIGGIKGADNSEVGNRVKAKVVKNKLAPPFQSAEFDIMFDEGISYTGNLLELAISYQVVDKKGSWLSFNGNRLGQGKESAIEELKKNKTALGEIETILFDKIKRKEKIVAPSAAAAAAANAAPVA